MALRGRSVVQSDRADNRQRLMEIRPHLNWFEMKASHSLHTLHPWHGISPGVSVPSEVRAFIEIVPTDTVKFEVDKISGHLMVDRPLLLSNQAPCLYGFVPQSYSGRSVAARCGEQGIDGDGDPLDICVFAERPVSHGGIIVRARPIGGVRMIDRNQVDDKIIAVLVNDATYGNWKTLGDCPATLVDRIRHYFLTYKLVPPADGAPFGLNPVRIKEVYDQVEACAVIKASLDDYQQLILQQNVS